MHTHRSSRLAPFTVSAAALCLLAGSALAQENAGANEPDSRQSVLVIEKVEVDKILIAPKDQALRRALKMLPKRLAELPGEVPGVEIDAEGIDLLTRLFSSPARIGITYDATDQPGGFFGTGVVISFGVASEQEAAKVAGTVSGLIQKGGNPPPMKASKGFAGMSEVSTPAGLVRMGPRKGATGWSYDVHLGTVMDADKALAELGNVKFTGVTPFIKGRFDPAPLTPLIGVLMMGIGGALGPQGNQQVAALQEAGIFGPDAAKWSMVLGHTEDRTVSVLTMAGVGDGFAKIGMTKDPIPDATLRAIPADAFFGSIAHMGIGLQISQLRAQAEQTPEFGQILEQIKGHTGVDLIDDVLGTFGETFISYVSDSTGGGGLGSSVFLVSLKDSKRFATANAKLAAMANAMAGKDGPVRGYAGIRPWTDQETAGVEFHTISFPGLPIPLEPTYAISGEWLIVGLSPQAAVAAARQAAGKGDAGFMSNPAVASMFPAGKKFTAVSFTDTSRVLRNGYPFVAGFGSMVANAVRSPGMGGGAEREPGLIVPPYAALASGAKSLVQFSYWNGNDFITEWHGDKSLLVNLGAEAGKYVTYAPLVAAVIAGGAAAFAEQRGGMMMPPDMMDGEGMDMEGDEGPNFRVVPAERR